MVFHKGLLRPRDSSRAECTVGDVVGDNKLHMAEALLTDRP